MRIRFHRDENVYDEATGRLCFLDELITAAENGEKIILVETNYEANDDDEEEEENEVDADTIRSWYPW